MIQNSSSSNRARGRRRSAGDEIVRGLTGLRDALRDRKRLERRFTVRTVELRLQPKRFTPADIRSLRLRLGASQPVFAMLLGVSSKTVQAWEQGNTPPPIARRLMDVIRNDPTPWRNMLESAVIEK